MIISMIGVNHETASVDWRESVSLTDTKKIELLEALMAYGIEECVILSTCGRFELYMATLEKNHSDLKREVIDFLKTFFNKGDFEDHFYYQSGEQAVRHLYKVAIGLDSAVLGEDQILGQVKDAHQFAMMIGSSGKVLNTLFRDGAAAAKQIKTTLKISEHPLSLSYIAIKKAKEILGELAGKQVLIVGLGKMGQLALKSLLDEKVAHIDIAVRNPGKTRLEELTDKERELINVISYDERYLALEKADLVIGATAAPHTVIRAEAIHQVKSGALFMDLALPRDFEPEISKVFPVQMIDVDGLKDISESNAQKRIEISQRAESMILDAVADFMKWTETAKVDHLLKLWHEEIDSIHEDTMNYFSRKLTSIEHRDLMLIDKMLESALKRLIRKPVNVLKNIEDQDKRSDAIDLIKELFEYE